MINYDTNVKELPSLFSFQFYSSIPPNPISLSPAFSLFLVHLVMTYKKKYPIKQQKNIYDLELSIFNQAKRFHLPVQTQLILSSKKKKKH